MSNEKITQEDLILAVQKKLEESGANVPKKFALTALKAVFGTLEDALLAGNVVTVSGFGTFQVKTTEERRGVNPKTSEVITIAAGKRLAFKASTTIKNKLK